MYLAQKKKKECIDLYTLLWPANGCRMKAFKGIIITTRLLSH